MSARGGFITIEGADGVGKTTNRDFVHRLLLEHDHDVLVTREPGGTPLAEEIRTLLLAERDETVDPTAEMLLIFAARAQHVATVIAPALRAGRWVLCDRFTDSTFAYQGGGRSLGADKVQRLADLVHGDLWPDLTLYLDAPVDAALGRIATGDLFNWQTEDLDRFERDPRDFFERVRTVFRHRARDHAYIVEVDASRKLEAVQRQLRRAVEGFLAAWQETA